MSKYYNPKKSAKYCFVPDSKESHKISRSKIDLFVECPRCFYLDQRLGVGRPPGYPFSLNNAVDELLKKEFDAHRKAKTAHPLMQSYKIDAIPFEHPDLEGWRDALRRGVQYLHSPTNLLIRGGVDDIWVNPEGELYVVDYKATSKRGEVNLDAEWQDGYKRQMEVYQWLLRKNGFAVSNTGYFVYVNASTDREAFDARLEFDVKIIPYEGDDSWIEETIHKVHTCLMDDRVPAKGTLCDYCPYREEAGKALIANQKERHLEEAEKPARADKSEAKKTSSLF